MKKVGLSIAVADAVAEVFPYIIYKTEKPGGAGAVREVTDLLLKAKNIVWKFVKNFFENGQPNARRKHLNLLTQIREFWLRKSLKKSF